MSFTLPGGTPALEQAVERVRREMPRFPIGLWQVGTASLPNASDYTGRLVWDTTELVVKWSDGTSWVKPALSTHTHEIADVTGLQAALDGKAASSHSHAPSDITGLDLDAWTEYTPTVSPTSGAITTSSATGRYWKLGRVVHFQAEVTITANGTGAGVLRVSAPFASSQNNVFVGKEVAITGSLLTATVGVSGSTLNVVTYANAYPGGNNHIITITGTYEATA